MARDEYFSVAPPAGVIPGNRAADR